MKQSIFFLGGLLTMTISAIFQYMIFSQDKVMDLHDQINATIYGLVLISIVVMMYHLITSKERISRSFHSVMEAYVMLAHSIKFDHIWEPGKTYIHHDLKTDTYSFFQTPSLTDVGPMMPILERITLDKFLDLSTNPSTIILKPKPSDI